MPRTRKPKTPTPPPLPTVMMTYDLERRSGAVQVSRYPFLLVFTPDDARALAFELAWAADEAQRRELAFSLAPLPRVKETP